MSEPSEIGPAARGEMSKRTITEQATALRLICHMDNDQDILASMSEDHHAAIEEFFEKRAPMFRGKRSVGYPPKTDSISLRSA